MWQLAMHRRSQYYKNNLITFYDFIDVSVGFFRFLFDANFSASNDLSVSNGLNNSRHWWEFLFVEKKILVVFLCALINVFYMLA